MREPLPFPLPRLCRYAKQWTARVCEEFWAQGDEERARDLAVTPMFDRTNVNVPKQQLGFYNFIVGPMYEAMDELVPMTEQLANLQTMRAYWGAKIDDA
jgi:hypothetical protein